MGGGGKGGGGAPRVTAADLERQARGYWQSYSQWVQEAGASREQDIANLRARMGASGGAGSELFERQIAEREQQYQTELQSLREGEHGRWLQDYFAGNIRPTGGSALTRVAGTANRQAAAQRFSTMEEYYTDRFGAAQSAQMSAEERAQQTAAMAGTTRARRPAQPGEGGPTAGSGLIRDQERLTSGWW